MLMHPRPMAEIRGPSMPRRRWGWLLTGEP